MSNPSVLGADGAVAEEKVEIQYSSGEYTPYIFTRPAVLHTFRPGMIHTEWEFLDLLGDGIPLWKRGMDIIGAVIGLALLFPLMALVAITIKCTSPGPVFFRQKRAGFHSRPFTFYKFRSMCVNADVMQQALRQYNERRGPAFKMTNDPRITPVGRFLRRWSIDELPQLYNVLIGDISLVGPRPLPVEENDGCQHWQRSRLDVHPGITCLWQILARDRSGFDSWMRLDLKYVRRRSPALDFRILLGTIPAVLSRRGAV